MKKVLPRLTLWKDLLLSTEMTARRVPTRNMGYAEGFVHIGIAAAIGYVIIGLQIALGAGGGAAMDRFLVSPPYDFLNKIMIACMIAFVFHALATATGKRGRMSHAFFFVSAISAPFIVANAAAMAAFGNVLQSQVSLGGILLSVSVFFEFGLFILMTYLLAIAVSQAYKTGRGHALALLFISTAITGVAVGIIWKGFGVV